MEKVELLAAQPGCIVRDPITKTPLSEDGELKPLTGRAGIYWRRRIKDGNVFILKEKIIKKSKNTKKINVEILDVKGVK